MFKINFKFCACTDNILISSTQKIMYTNFSPNLKTCSFNTVTGRSRVQANKTSFMVWLFWRNIGLKSGTNINWSWYSDYSDVKYKQLNPYLIDLNTKKLNNSTLFQIFTKNLNLQKTVTTKKFISLSKLIKKRTRKKTLGFKRGRRFHLRYFLRKKYKNNFYTNSPFVFRPKNYTLQQGRYQLNDLVMDYYIDLYYLIGTKWTITPTIGTRDYLALSNFFLKHKYTAPLWLTSTLRILLKSLNFRMTKSKSINLVVMRKHMRFFNYKVLLKRKYVIHRKFKKFTFSSNARLSLSRHKFKTLNNNIFYLKKKNKRKRYMVRFKFRPRWRVRRKLFFKHTLNKLSRVCGTARIKNLITKKNKKFKHVNSGFYMFINFTSNLFRFFINKNINQLACKLFLSRVTVEESLLKFSIKRIGGYFSVRRVIEKFLKQAKIKSAVRDNFYWLNLNNRVKLQNSYNKTRGQVVAPQHFSGKHISEICVLEHDSDFVFNDDSLSSFSSRKNSLRGRFKRTLPRKKYLLNMHDVKLKTYRTARHIHWSFFNKHKTIKERGYKLFLKKFMKKKKDILSAYFYILNSKFSLPWGFWQYVGVFLQKFSGLKSIKRFGIYCVPLNYLFFKELALVNRKQQKFKFRVRRWLAKKATRRGRFWMLPRKNLPKILWHMVPEYRKFNYFVQYDIFTNTFAVIKDDFQHFNYRGVLNLMENHTMKLLNYRYKA